MSLLHYEANTFSDAGGGMTPTLRWGRCKNPHKLLPFMSAFFSTFLVGNETMMTQMCKGFRFVSLLVFRLFCNILCTVLWFCQMKHQEWTLNLMPDTVCVAATWMICSLSSLAASLHANFWFLLCYLFMPLITILHTASRLSSYFKFFHWDFPDFCTASPSQSAFRHPHYYASKRLCDGGDFKRAFQTPPAGGQIALGICVDLPQNLSMTLHLTGEPVELLGWSCNKARWANKV